MRAILVVLLLALAGCTTAPEPATGSDSDSPQSDSASFGYSIDPPAGPITDYQWTVTGTVDQETRIAAAQGPVHDFVGEHQVFNGSWSLDVDLEAGAQEVWIDLQAVHDEESAFVIMAVDVLAAATVSIDYGDTSSKGPVNNTFWLNFTSYAAQSHYDEKGARHPEFVNVHDVLAAWEEQFNHVIDYAYNPSIQGFSVSRIDGEGNAIDAEDDAVGSRDPPYWCYTINGESDGVNGITAQQFTPDDVIHWELGSCGTLGFMT